MRHRWHPDAISTYGSRRTTCIRCGIVKDARFDRNFHWTEYKKPGEPQWTVEDKTPPCEPTAQNG